MIHGKDITLSIDGLTVAAAQACELDVKRDFLSICAPHGAGAWKHYKPSTMGWTAAISMLVVDMADPQAWLAEMKSSATPLTVRYYDTQLNMYQKGTAWISEWHNAAQVGSLATFSVQLQGTGALNNAEKKYVVCDLDMFADLVINRTATRVLFSIDDRDPDSGIEYTHIHLDRTAKMTINGYGADNPTAVIVSGHITPAAGSLDNVVMYLKRTQSYPDWDVTKILPAGDYTLIKARQRDEDHLFVYYYD